MRFATPLIPATLIRRYKRFLADVVLEDGREVTAHCPNPGAMLGLDAPGSRIWVEPNEDPRKKLHYGWRLSDLPGGHMAGIDTGVPNRVVGEVLRAGAVPGLEAYGGVRAEVKYGAASRVDFLLSGHGLPDAYVEVKNVHLRRTGDLAEFPDCVTTRGAKHLRELSDMVAQGHRAVMVYLVQRTDCRRLAMAADLDPGYAAAFEAARGAGVEVICLSTRITTEGVWAGDPLPLAGG
ncbi:MAG: DNA/RNA nuclease SfsA [Jannaschia sp.]